jgi:hypothetical protein
MKHLILWLLTLISFSCFGQKQKAKLDWGNIWVSSLDSLLVRNPPEHIAELCSLGKEMKQLSPHDIRTRKRQYKRGIRDFPLSFILVEKSPVDHTGSYSPSLNRIVIYASKNYQRFGDETRWVSRSLLFLHELKHASNALTAVDTLRSMSECEALAIEAECIRFLFPEIPQTAQDITLDSLGAVVSITEGYPPPEEGRYLWVQVYDLRQKAAFEYLEQALR